MTKNDVKTWADLETFARLRARASAKRNDPWAWAYWRETAKWAVDRANQVLMLEGCLLWIEDMIAGAELAATNGDYAVAARSYSHAKWLAIMLRNRGVRVPKARGPKLDWLRKFEPKMV